jgi:hypothetical protein
MIDPRIRPLEALKDELRLREYEFRNSFPGVPCQCETSWHADEIKGWADQLEALLRSSVRDDEKEKDDLSRIGQPVTASTPQHASTERRFSRAC